MGERRAIAVRISGQEYRIASEPDPASMARVQRAAALVDETMAKIRDRTGVLDTLNTAVLAALNIANRFIVHHDAHPRASPGEWIEPERVEALIRLVESAGEASPAP